MDSSMNRNGEFMFSFFLGEGREIPGRRRGARGGGRKQSGHTEQG